jgi:6-pyruvoyltetrahydropterin/6-carboxytetrahydropterin synthase
MKISKEFHWEMGHRLPEHEGLCRNVHGHSYKMVLEIEGKVQKNGMVIDFYDLNKIVMPIINKYDHAFMCNNYDKTMLDFLKKNKMKYVAVNFHTTVENICEHLANEIVKHFKKLKMRNIDCFTVNIFETPNDYASVTKRVAK